MLVLNSLSSFYADHDPSPWDGGTHSQGGKSLTDVARGDIYHR